MAILELREQGLYCQAGDFYVDPWEPVHRALVTHAHSDHASPGSDLYLTAAQGEPLLRQRLGPEASVQGLEYGATLSLSTATVSFHPAGHILGSGQVRIEVAGEVWVVSGDYKLAADRTCPPFEPLRCHTFVTESTFGLPIFRWPETAEVIAGIHAWWRANREAGKTSVLYGWPLGKMQRVLAELDAAIGPIYAHGAVERVNRIYWASGIRLTETPAPSRDTKGALILAPPGCQGSPWMKRFGNASTALVSGWMRIRGTRRRRSLDRGFVLSDHADWPALLKAIDETGAETVWVTHGLRAPLVRWLQEHGRNAVEVPVRMAEEQPGVEEYGS
ncbi:MAG TPA: ligase-associated DNA damage response exonuclease [Bryobacteraceae bacterium]|nr:ligase-associated DNA damage response exonuclease [Bryobacteraceae bacterium]